MPEMRRGIRQMVGQSGGTGKDVADYHDWEVILGKLHLLSMDHILAYMAQITGIFLMAAAPLWATANVWIQFREWRRRN